MRYVTLTLANALVLVLLFVFIEGLSSATLFAYRLTDNWVTTGRESHTRYDPELGWVSRSNLSISDMYGPGISLTTNSRGFRGGREVAEQVPVGKRRLICSGDSVTFGFGVADDQSWCNRLEALDSRLETVNMGQTAYGLDQAYLWYKRDAGGFRHQIQLLATITDDFRRMSSATAWGGYGKPFLALEGGELKVRNVPVSAPRYYVPWANELAKDLTFLQTPQLVRAIHKSVTTTNAESTSPKPPSSLEAAVKVLPAMLEDLKRVNEERSSVLVLVYLPTFNDREPGTLAFLSNFLEQQTNALGIRLINLVHVFRTLPDHETLGFYLPDKNHFNPQGNDYIARSIYEKLREYPEISRILATRGGVHSVHRTRW